MDNKQVKARFFGAHIGCKCAITGKEMVFELVGLDYDFGNIEAVCLYSDESRAEVHRVLLDECKLVLRPLSSLTGNEMAHLDAISMHCGKNKMAIGYMRFDYLRSINICVPFIGFNPIAEGWAILDEKFSANAPQETPQEEKI